MKDESKTLPEEINFTHNNGLTNSFVSTEPRNRQSDIWEEVQAENLNKETQGTIRKGIHQILEGIETLDTLAYRPPHGEGRATNPQEIGIDLYECYVLPQFDNALAVLTLLSQKP